MYPQTIVTFRAALASYTPGEGHADAIDAAQQIASVAPQSVAVMDALKDAEGLTQDGLKLLVGAAYLIASNGWLGRAGDAATVLATRASELT